MALSDNARGAAFMSLSMAGFAINDGMMKAAMADTPLFQAIFVRGLFAVALIAGLAAAQGAFRRRFERRDLPVVALRTAAEIGSTICFLTALLHMPIADATAVIQAAPLAITLAAALFLRAPVGWRRWLAILVGFGGVMLIVRPGGEGFDADALWAVAAVGFIVLRDLSTRRLSPGAPSILVTLATATAIAAVGGAGAAFGAWVAITPQRLGLFAAAAGFLFVGYFFGIRAMRVGDIAAVSPFRYTVLLWALAIGVVAFGDLPDAATLAGAAIVVASGLYTLWRERVRRVPAAPAGVTRPRGA